MVGRHKIFLSDCLSGLIGLKVFISPARKMVKTPAAKSLYVPESVNPD
jgi:hypothetical protein